jgi:hypothetical protein
MIRTPFLIGAVLLSALLTGYVVGCVNVPANGPTPPDEKTQVRMVSLDPTLNPAVLAIASGPFTAGALPTYSDLTIGNPGVPLDYQVLPAGGRKLFVRGVDTDTGAVTFGTDTRGTLYILPHRPKGGGFVFASERYTFAVPGIADTTRIRFYNALASQDTVDVYEAVDGQVVNDLAYSRFSTFKYVRNGAAPKNYYFTLYNNDTTNITAPVAITIGSHMQYTITVYDSLGRAKVLAMQDN